MQTDYEKLYHLMFNRVTDALRLLSKGETAAAAETLISAQREAEELYIAEPET